MQAEDYSFKSNLIRAGMIIRLRNSKTQCFLHFERDIFKNESIEYDEVVSSQGRDYNDWWKVSVEDSTDGPIVNGTSISLTHVITGKKLCSNIEYKSDIPQMLRLYLLDNEFIEDQEDMWSVLIEDDHKVWKKFGKMKLVNLNSGGVLHNTKLIDEDNRYRVVCCLDDDDFDYWYVVEQCRPNEIAEYSYDDAYD